MPTAVARHSVTEAGRDGVAVYVGIMTTPSRGHGTHFSRCTV